MSGRWLRPVAVATLLAAWPSASVAATPVIVPLPGRAVELIAAPARDGNAGVVLALVRPTGEEYGDRSVWAISAEGESRQIAEGLDSETSAVAVVQVAGGTEAWIGDDEGVATLGPVDAASARPRRLLRGVALERLVRSGQLASPEPLEVMALPEVGRLRFVRLATGGPRPFGAVPLPFTARHESHGLRLASPRVRVVAGADSLRLAVGPEAVGKLRLRTRLVDPAMVGVSETTSPTGVETEIAAETESEVDDGSSWSRLPGAEDVAQSWIVAANGRPLLVVATTDAERLGIFSKLRLRVFALGKRDRSRAGSRPLLSHQTVTRNWYRLGVEIVDVDGDGNDDLVVLQPDGLGAKKLAVEVFRGRDGSAFENRARKSVVIAPSARWSYGGDWNGDGRPDLVALAGGELLVWQGVEHKKRVLTGEPSARYTLPNDDERVVSVTLGNEDTDIDVDEDAARFAGRPHVVDLDGDGRSEVVVRSSHADEKPTTVYIYGAF